MGDVLVTRRLPEGSTDPLREAGHRIVGNVRDEPWRAAELAGAVGDVDGLVCLLDDDVDAEVLERGAAGRLQVVANVAVGVDVARKGWLEARHVLNTRDASAVLAFARARRVA